MEGLWSLVEGASVMAIRLNPSHIENPYLSAGEKNDLLILLVTARTCFYLP